MRVFKHSATEVRRSTDECIIALFLRVDSVMGDLSTIRICTRARSSPSPCCLRSRVSARVPFIEAVLQSVVDQAPQARAYSRDGFRPYKNLVYGEDMYTAMLNKSQTYSVEGGNADLRHYVARLARKSRCFSRCMDALRRAVKRLVWCYNQCQL